MGMRNLEAVILRELRAIAGRQSIRQADIMEWSTGPVKAGEGESLFFLPDIRVHLAVKTAALGKKTQTPDSREPASKARTARRAKQKP